MVKPRLYDEESPEHFVAISVLKYTLGNILKLLHPYMPYITEEIYTTLTEEDTIVNAMWPEYNEDLHYDKAESDMKQIDNFLNLLIVSSLRKGCVYTKMFKNIYATIIFW